MKRSNRYLVIPCAHRIGEEAHLLVMFTSTFPSLNDYQDIVIPLIDKTENQSGQSRINP